MFFILYIHYENTWILYQTLKISNIAQKLKSKVVLLFITESQNKHLTVSLYKWEDEMKHFQYTVVQSKYC